MDEIQVNLDFEVFDCYRSILTCMPRNCALSQTGLCYGINFSITIQDRLPRRGPHIYNCIAYP